VNGVSVVQVDVGFVTYHHIELETHDVVVSEGLPTESYLDAGNRGVFEGEAGFVLHPDLSGAAEGARPGCLPRLFEGAEVAAARACLLGRLAAFGAVWAEDGDELGVVEAEGRGLGVLRVGENEVVVPAGVRRVGLRSSVFVPAGRDPGDEDCRVLGLRLQNVALDGVEVPLAAPLFARGFHGVEACGRWTDGAGVLVLPPHAGPRRLRLTLAPRPAFWRLPFPQAPLRHAA